MKYLYLPIVKMQRELDAKLVLAREVSKTSGWVVVLCTVRWMKENFNNVPPGVINWGTSKTGVDYIKDFKSSGHKVFGFCEEGVVWDERVYRARKLDSDALRELDMFFAWGDVQAELAKEVQPDSKITVSGNPRFDLLLEDYRGIYAKEISQVAKRFGEYFLVVSRGSNFNDRQSLEQHSKNRKHLYADEIDWLSYYENLSDNWYQIAELAIRLATEYPTLTIVFRPKFSEPRDFIYDYFKDAPSNLKIDGSGNVHPLIIGAKAVISRHCTTMVEAELVGRPNICYDPKPWEGFRARISEECFPHVGSDEEVNTKLGSILLGNDAGNASIVSPRNFALAFENTPSSPIVAQWLEENVADAEGQKQLDIDENPFMKRFRKVLRKNKRARRARPLFEEPFNQQFIENRWNMIVKSLGGSAAKLPVSGSRAAFVIGYNAGFGHR